MRTDIAPEDYDPPQLGQLIVLGLVGALGGIVAGFVLSLTPLGEVAFVLGVLAGPAVAGWSAYRQGTNGLGVAIVLVAAVVTYAFVAYAFGLTTVSDWSS